MTTPAPSPCCPCPPPGTAAGLLLCDTAPDGTITQFVRIYLDDGTHEDQTIDGAVYTPSTGGTVGQCSADQTDGCDTTTPVTAASLCLADGTPIVVVVQRDCAGTVSAPGWVNLITGVFTVGTVPAGAGTCEQVAAADCDTTTAIATAGLCLADGTPVAVVMQRDCAGTVTAPGWVDLTSGVFTAGALPAGAGVCDQIAAADCDTTTAIATTSLCLADGTPITVVTQRDCAGLVSSPGWVNLITGVFTAGTVPAGAGTCEQVAAADCDTTTPVATTGLCLADGTPIAVTVERGCDGVVTRTGWLDLATGAWSAGAPPAGTRACGETSAFDVSGLVCDVDPTTGDVLGLVLIEVERGPDGEVTGVVLRSAVDGSVYTLAGELSVCPTGTEQPERDLVILCDVVADGTATPFIRDYARDENGAIVGHTDYNLDNTIHPIAGTVTTCSPTPDADTCQDCEVLVLCDVTPGSNATLTDTVAAGTDPAQYMVLPGGGDALWDGGTLVFPAEPAPAPAPAPGDVGVLSAGSVWRGVAAIINAQGCTTGDVTVTASVTVTMDGAAPVSDLGAGLEIFDGATLVNQTWLDDPQPVTGETRTISVTATVPAASVAAGTVKVQMWALTLDLFEAHTWTASGFAANVDGCAATPADPVRTPFLRTVCRSCVDGSFLSTTDTLLDGTTIYLPAGTVEVCTGTTTGSVGGAERDLVVLCDVAADGTSSMFVRDYERDEQGAVIGHADYTLDGTAVYAPAGTVGLCPATADPESVVCETLRLCDQVTQTSQIGPFPPQNVGGGTLPNGVTWTRTNPGQAGFTTRFSRATGNQTWTFDRIVDLRFDIRLSGTSSVQLPLGVGVIMPIAATHIWDPATRTLRGDGSATVGVTSFALSDVVEFTTSGIVGGSFPDIGNVDVTATTQVPFLRTTCRDNTGAVVSTTNTTLAGAVYAVAGTVVDCAAAPVEGALDRPWDTEVVPLCDVQPDGSVVEFIRVYAFDGRGVLAGIDNRRVSNPAATYVPTGTVQFCAGGGDTTGVEVVSAPACVVDNASGTVLQRIRQEIVYDETGAVQTIRFVDAITGGPVGVPGGASIDVCPNECLHCTERVLCDDGGLRTTNLVSGTVATSTLPNGITWSVEGNSDAWAAGQSNADGSWWSLGSFPNNQITPGWWTFSHPVDVEFSVILRYSTLGGLQNQFQVPIGTEVVSLPPGYDYDAAAGIVSVDETVTDCDPLETPTRAEGARFRLRAVSDMMLRFLGTRVASCGTFNTYAMGSLDITPAGAKFLRTTCRDCDGEIVGTPTDTALDGVTAYVPLGTVGACPEPVNCETTTLCDTPPTEQVLGGTFPDAAAVADNWTVTGPVSWQTSPDTEGVVQQFVDFSGGAAAAGGTIQQIITGLEPGEVYEFSARFGAWAAGSSKSQVARVQIFDGANAVLHDETITVSGLVSSGVQFPDSGAFGPVPVTATDSTMRVLITDLSVEDQGQIDLLVDDVSLLAPERVVRFQRTTCRSADGGVVAITDTTIDGVTPYDVLGEVTACAPADICCQPVQVCITPTRTETLEFVTNPDNEVAGQPDPVWTWRLESEPETVAWPTYHGPPNPDWTVVDTDLTNPANWVTPHPNSSTVTTGAPGEGPTLAPLPIFWIAKASFDLPPNADPASILVQATIIAADQEIRGYRINGGAWIETGTGTGPAGNYKAPAYTFPAQVLAGAQAGTNVLELRVRETSPGPDAGIKAHLIVTYQVPYGEQRSWTRMVCCDGGLYYLDESGTRQDTLPEFWTVSPCGADLTPDAPLLTGIRRLTGDTAVQNLAVEFPGLQSVTLTVIAGQVNAAMTSGAALVPAGTSLTWSVADDDDGALDAATFDGAAGADYIAHWTYKPTSDG